MTIQYSAESRHRLLQVARKSLDNFLENGQRTKFVTETPELLEKRAVFVTLKELYSGDLRGCIGQTEACYPLIDAIAKTAISSAVDDSRFRPVILEELPYLLIGINVLSPMRTIKPEDVKVGKHGLLINKGSYRGLFLPEVAVSQGWDHSTFLDELCLKADLPKGSWQDEEAKLLAFESEAWKEN